MTEILQSIPWSLTIPIAAVVVAWLLRQPLGELIGRLRSVKGEGAKYEVLFGDQNPQTLPKPDEKILNKTDVIEAFKQIPDFGDSEVRENLDAVYYYLIRNGIVTKAALVALVSAEDTLDAIRALYVDLLYRPKERPLDPLAVATWAAFLFRYHKEPAVMDVIVRGIIGSPEYHQKHALENRA
ncbi:hypothetical protein [Candidatus Methylomirabilis sp.]|uniref:hypothetical protein n=1 Tax=Candidatus Methylomirabilis sp. TaxID=2032687 RepID=UPI0030766146